MKTVRRPPYPKWDPGYFPCSSLTPPSAFLKPSFGGFGLKQAKFQEADGIRQELLEAGYVVEDARGATRVRPRARWEAHEDAVGTISSAAEVRSNLNVPDTVDFTIGLVFRNYIEDVGRCVQSALRWAGERSVELVAVDNASTDETGLWLEAISKKDTRIQVTHVDHPLGAAASRNLVLKLSRGKPVVLLEPGVEVRGEYLEELDRLLSPNPPKDGLRKAEGGVRELQGK